MSLTASIKIIISRSIARHTGIDNCDKLLRNLAEVPKS